MRSSVKSRVNRFLRSNSRGRSRSSSRSRSSYPSTLGSRTASSIYRSIHKIASAEVQKGGDVLSCTVGSTTPSYSSATPFCILYLNPCSPLGSATAPVAGDVITTWTQNAGGLGANIYSPLLPMYRTSDYVKIKKIHLRMMFYTTALKDVTVRMILFKTKMAKGATPAGSNLLDASDSISSLYNIAQNDFHKRYAVYYDRTKIIRAEDTPSYSANNLTNNNNSAIPYVWNVKKTLNFTADYSLANAGLLSDQDDGQLCLTVLSDQSASLSFYPNLLIEFHQMPNERKRLL